MKDERMGNSNNIGKFMKQYFVNFADGAELHAWIFLTDECHLIYGHNFKSSSGENELYTSAYERDFFEFPILDEAVTMYFKTVAMHSKSLMRVIEFPPEVSLLEQFEAMEKIGVATSHLHKVDKKYEEIKMLDELWEVGENKMEDKRIEDCSSMDWLMSCVHKWEAANKEKGRIVEFFGSFFALNPERELEIKEDRVFAFGLKKTILNTLTDIRREIKKEKNDFVNW